MNAGSAGFFIRFRVFSKHCLAMIFDKVDEAGDNNEDDKRDEEDEDDDVEEE
jgi:hypothetical protein